MAVPVAMPAALEELRRVGLRPASELVVEQATGGVLPVRADLAAALPHGGLPRGSVVSVLGSTSLSLGLLAAATERGSWAAVVGRPDLGVLAAHELGVDISRLALVPKPGPDVLPVLGALLDGIDLVAVSARCLAAYRRGATLRKLATLARHRGSVLLLDAPWPGAQLTLRTNASSWAGMGKGHGYLREQRLSISAQGRGRARGVELTLPRPVPGLADDQLPAANIAEVG